MIYTSTNLSQGLCYNHQVQGFHPFQYSSPPFLTAATISWDSRFSTNTNNHLTLSHCQPSDLVHYQASHDFASSERCGTHNTEVGGIGQSFFKYTIINWLLFTCARHIIQFLCEGAPHKEKKKIMIAFYWWTIEPPHACIFLQQGNPFPARSSTYQVEQGQYHHQSERVWPRSIISLSQLIGDNAR